MVDKGIEVHVLLQVKKQKSLDMLFELKEENPFVYGQTIETLNSLVLNKNWDKILAVLMYVMFEEKLNQ